MKFCKDCKHYIKGSVLDGSMLLPGFVHVIPDQCKRYITVRLTTDPVSGKPKGGLLGECSECRSFQNLCGLSGAWFEPANLDGHLAALEN